MKTVEGLYYSKDHEWLKIEGDTGIIGISDHAQHSLGDIVYVEVPEEDDHFDAGDSFGTIESVKAASDLLMPVGGTVLEVNESLEDEPGSVNSAPYESWIIKIKFDDVSELEALLDAAGYTAFCEEEA
ncbi:glycine cleavage system protein GcvH [Fusibacter paucivorans]|uniref:Glycine cleavage system H protein n=1 Tax=Fusibacter paucivorans TaxID=76009 RepID=A0ABS5PRX6_9FIRM|nr:glycine cleavage system protein GcvH [Fusibacter paucivorans]MBS7527908.1 glycine cleavage system protein GcvH [Fusibacter paucivorans]